MRVGLAFGRRGASPSLLLGGGGKRQQHLAFGGLKHPSLAVCSAHPPSCLFSRSKATSTPGSSAAKPLRSQILPPVTDSRYLPPADLVLSPCNVNQIRLNTLSDNPGAKKTARRAGRGIGSSKGKTCGFGTKGQKARGLGKVRPGFEGGQTPLYKRVRKYGFSNSLHKQIYHPVNLAKLQWWIDTGRIDPTKKITMKVMREAGLVCKLTKRSEHGFKLLSDGHTWFNHKVDIEISKASRQAIEAVERLGGTVKEVYYHRIALQKALRSSGHELPPPQEYRD
ncbi:YmL10 [Balamuthia mandrillaris]